MSKFKQWRLRHPKLSLLGGIALFFLCAYLFGKVMYQTGGSGGGVTPYVNNGVDGFASDVGLQSTQEYAMDSGSSSGGSSVGTTAVDLEKTKTKKVYSGSMQLDTVKFDSVYDDVTSIINEVGGFIESDDVSYDDYGIDDKAYRNCHMRVRVPGEKFESVVDSLSKIDNVSITSKSVSSEDITKMYTSLESELNAAKNQLERLKELYASATVTADKISLISEISNLEIRVQSIEDNLKFYDDTVTYSQLYITINEASPLEVRTAVAGYGNKLIEAFKTGWNGGLEFFGAIGLLLARLWLILAVAIVIILVGRKIYKVRHADNTKSDERPENVSEVLTENSESMNHEEDKE